MRFRSAMLFAGLAILALKVALALMGCSAPAVQRETARAAVLTVAEAVRVADLECAMVVKATRDEELARACLISYAAARAELVGVSGAIDLWDQRADKGSVACAVGNASRELAILSRVIVSKGGRPLPVVADAASLAKLVGDCTKDGGP